MNAKKIRFSQEDLELFCQASGDRNPLHLAEEYASKTAYGQRVVFGVLGVIASLGYLEFPADQSVSRITADFHRPMFLDVDYLVEKSDAGPAQTVRLFDGTVLILTVAVTCEQTGDVRFSRNPRPGLFEGREACRLTWKNLQTDMEFSGFYAADSGKLEELSQRWNVTADPLFLEKLLWSSYFVGMHCPGRNALFFRLALDFERDPASHEPLRYVGIVSSLNKAVEQVKIRVALSSNGSQVASGLLTAFLRPELLPFDMQPLLPEKSRTGALMGKVAVIIGASRGLGAALMTSVALEGAQVIAVSRSRIEFDTAFPSHIAQNIASESSDATDTESMAALRNRIVKEFGRLDFLICNAFPPIPSLRLEVNALGRMQSYIKQSTDLVLVPLCTLLPLLNESRGCVAIISSSAVEKPVREWPHYVAAKSAIESFGSIAPLQYPNVSALIVRPERLLTEMTNTPMGRRNALPPAAFAHQIVKKLQHPPLPGTAEIFRGNTQEFADD